MRAKQLAYDQDNLSLPCQDSGGEGPTKLLTPDAAKRSVPHEYARGQRGRWEELTGAGHLSHLYYSIDNSARLTKHSRIPLHYQNGHMTMLIYFEEQEQSQRRQRCMR